MTGFLRWELDVGSDAKHNKTIDIISMWGTPPQLLSKYSKRVQNSKPERTDLMILMISFLADKYETTFCEITGIIP